MTKWVLVSDYNCDLKERLVAHHGMLWIWDLSILVPGMYYDSLASAKRALKRLDNGKFKRKYGIENAVFYIMEKNIK